MLEPQGLAEPRPISRSRFRAPRRSSDSRWDSAGPGNTGFAYFRSRCRTLDFSRAILASLQVLLASSSDQRFLMRMLHGPEFSQNISFALLPISRFINGPNLLGHKNAPWQRQPGMLDANDQGFPPPRWIAGHASWTASHKDKPPMLRKLGAWHFSWFKMASALFEDSAPSASLDGLRARVAPMHPRAQPEHLGGLPRGLRTSPQAGQKSWGTSTLNL